MISIVNHGILDQFTESFVAESAYYLHIHICEHESKKGPCRYDSYFSRMKLFCQTFKVTILNYPELCSSILNVDSP